MVAIPFPLSTSPGVRVQEDAGRLFNCYAEPVEGIPQRPAIYRRMPGLKSWGTSSQTGFRGMLALPGTLYAAFDGHVVRFTSAGGAATTHGSLAGDKKLFFARNNNSTPDVVAVDPDNGASQITSGSVIAYPDVDVEQPNSVGFLGGYFFFTYGDGVCRASGINTTAINTSDFVTAESNPDGLYRAIPFNSQLLLFGSNSCEFFSGAVVNDTGFPFNKVTATPHGLAGRYAIAGHEDGYGKALLWVGSDNRVHYLKGGYDPIEVSPLALDRLIEAVSDKHTLEACIHVVAGIPWWVLSSDDWTWAFNINTLKWSERASYLNPRWRGTQSHFAFGKWLIGDAETGNILEVDAATKKELTGPLRVRLESLPVMNFPNRMAVPRADFDFTMGVGVATGDSANEIDPIAEIAWCDDGLNWSNPLQRPLGRQAIANNRVSLFRTGTAGPAGRRWRIDVTDPVDFAFSGGDMVAGVRAK